MWVGRCPAAVRWVAGVGLGVKSVGPGPGDVGVGPGFAVLAGEALVLEQAGGVGQAGGVDGGRGQVGRVGTSAAISLGQAAAVAVVPGAMPSSGGGNGKLATAEEAAGVTQRGVWDVFVTGLCLHRFGRRPGRARRVGVAGGARVACRGGCLRRWRRRGRPGAGCADRGARRRSGPATRPRGRPGAAIGGGGGARWRDGSGGAHRAQGEGGNQGHDGGSAGWVAGRAVNTGHGRSCAGRAKAPEPDPARCARHPRG